MAKVLFYKMTDDWGFAPNPFGKYLTLAACTPNHQRAKLEVGDYIVGVETDALSDERKKEGYKKEITRSLIYIAKVSEILTLDQYFREKRFSYKKYEKSSDWTKQRGDNNYYIKDGKWKWLRRHDHDLDELSHPEPFFNVAQFDELWRNRENLKYGAILQDIRGDRVFISKDYLYFGDMCLEFNEKFQDCLPLRGIEYCEHRKDELLKYIDILFSRYDNGKLGNPINCHIYDYCTKDKEKDDKSCGSK